MNPSNLINPSLVYFSATWCVPCQAVSKIIDQLKEEYKDKVDFFDVDVDKNAALAAKYGVMSIPNIILFKNGIPVSQLVGIQTKGAIKKKLDGLL